MNKVNIFGCAADDNGGAICFQEGKCNNTIKMLNSSIERCLSRDHGAAVANNSDADNNTVIFRKAEQDSFNCGMFYNVANRYGGAAFTEGKAFSLIGDAKINEYGNVDDRSVACISNNVCDRSGGMIEIQCKHSDVLIKGFNIDSNRALGEGSYNGDGGAVDHCNGKVTMVDCNFRNNHGHGDGGAIYMGEDGTLQNCCVKDNTADGEGGGIYVAGDDTLSLGDYVYVYDNHGSNEATDLHISGRIFRNGYLDGNVNIGSWIGVSASVLRTVATLSEVSVSLDEDCFFCTQSYQHVEAEKVAPGGQPDKYTGHIFLRGGKETKKRSTFVTIDEVNASYKETDKTYNDQSIYKGTTQFHTQNHEDEALGTYYYYSDGYFADPEEKYNEHLATCSLALASSSGPTVRDEQGIRDYTKQYTYAYQFLESIGCNRENIAFNDSYRSKPTTDSIGVICGSKEIKVNNDTRTLIPVAIRGLDYEQE